MTIADLLSDPDIPRLQYADIELGKAVGRGAYGLVSSGVWKQ